MNGHAEPLVSIVVPTHDAVHCLRETLDAARAQTYGAVELIVVDDGSTDGTPALVRREYPEARLVEQANAGVSAARNRGLGEARGRYVVFLDQDDIWFPEMLSRQVQCLEARSEAAAAACPYAFWYPGTPQGAALRRAPPDPGLHLVMGFEGWTYHQFLLDCWALTSATLLRADAVRAVGGFDETLPYSEDWDLWLRLAWRHPFLQLAWPPVLYRQHPGQGSRQPRPIDYRCRLLMQAARRHGLASPDGQAVSARRFAGRVAQYRMEFGYHHLQRGDRWVGVRALLQSWAEQPRQARRLALAAAGALGWRPRAG